jgi:hypothetical protein
MPRNYGRIDYLFGVGSIRNQGSCQQTPNEGACSVQLKRVPDLDHSMKVEFYFLRLSNSVFSAAWHSCTTSGTRFPFHRQQARRRFRTLLDILYSISAAK